jgi:multiple sugar transport system substrate-binding protein
VSNLSRRGALRVTASIALSCILPLAGCGRSADPAATVTAKSIDDSPASGAISVWAAQGDADVLDKVIKPFKTENPALDVKFTLIPNAEYYTKLQSAIAAGKGPDVAQFFPESQAQFLDPSILQPGSSSR